MPRRAAEDATVIVECCWNPAPREPSLAPGPDQLRERDTVHGGECQRLQKGEVAPTGGVLGGAWYLRLHFGGERAQHRLTVV